ncbi:ATP/GTP-binding protein [uncultured Clostridium sp.]|uniref:AAA family ATPase n=1 Tax=uncultured Clostridium sp. TaxID=59620 RepID=UPI0025E755B9|nr:AAA family ATPase [uncultured Clostridium sp.]
MFTNIKLKNFKSFKNVEIDLQEKKGEYKPLVIIYGENGSGKTTIAQAFLALERTMETMQVKGMLKDLLDEKFTPPDDFPLKPEIMLKMLKSKLSFNGIESIIEKYKMINSNENLSLEYEFNIEGGTGSYYIEMNSFSIVKERLEYKLNKNRGCYYNIDEDGIYINEKIFESKEFYDLIKNQIEMYWGKHTLLSILYFEMNDKADAYINSNISINLMKVMTAFEKINFRIPKAADGNQISLNSENEIIGHLVNGMIDKKDEKILDKVEKLLNRFFKALFSDVIKAFYKKTNKKGEIRYELYLRKRIEDHEYDIDFQLESNGTQEIMKVLPYLISAVSGSCVIIDEYGIGIHDLLAAKLLASLANQIKGQLIITTHNTLLMDDEEINPEALYYIMNDKTFKKSVKCATEIEERLHPNYNYRKRYFTNELYKDALPNIQNNINLEELAKLYS